MKLLKWFGKLFDKWYDKSIWIYLSLLIPLLAIYGIYKNNTWDQDKKRKFYGYALILLLLNIIANVYGPSLEERKAQAAAEERQEAVEATAKEKERNEQADAKAWDEKRLARENAEKDDFLNKYKSFGAPKILYRCGDEVSYSVGVGMNSTYNRLVSEAREKCEQFDWQKGKFRILESQQ